jgi:LytS/YehU family sensor histidine kinase
MPPERVQITGWFRLYPLVGITTNMFVILGIIQIVGSSIENERLRNEKLTLDIANLQARLGQLRLQIQPHFLFNALANLQSWVRQEPEQAAVYLGTLSSFLRTSTQSQLKDMHPVGDEMKLVKDYLEIQKMRFGSALDFTIDVDAELLDLNIPTFAIQVLVENAIKHNRFSPSDPLKLAISGKGNQIAIANELRPLPDSARAEPSGIGLTNLSDRFHLIGLRPPKVQASNDRFEVIIFLEPCT